MLILQKHLFNRLRRPYGSAVLLACVVALSTACGGPDRAARARMQALSDLSAPAMVGGSNHTAQYIYSWTVRVTQEPNATYPKGITWGSAGGPLVDEYSGASASICCASLPLTWVPELRATVRWQIGRTRQEIDSGVPPKPWTEVTVPIEPYEKPASLYVHFFDQDKVRVVSTGAYPTSPYHPIPLDTNQLNHLNYPLPEDVRQNHIRRSQEGAKP